MVATPKMFSAGSSTPLVKGGVGHYQFEVKLDVAASHIDELTESFKEHMLSKRQYDGHVVKVQPIRGNYYQERACVYCFEGERGALSMVGLQSLLQDLKGQNVISHAVHQEALGQVKSIQKGAVRY
jgi:hypothetical protein